MFIDIVMYLYWLSDLKDNFTNACFQERNNVSCFDKYPNQVRSPFLVIGKLSIKLYQICWE